MIGPCGRDEFTWACCCSRLRWWLGWLLDTWAKMAFLLFCARPATQLLLSLLGDRNTRIKNAAKGALREIDLQARDTGMTSPKRFIGYNAAIILLIPSCIVVAAAGRERSDASDCRPAGSHCDWVGGLWRDALGERESDRHDGLGWFWPASGRIRRTPADSGYTSDCRDPLCVGGPVSSSRWLRT